MTKLATALILLVTGCSNAADSQRHNATCPASQLKMRAEAAAKAEIVVTGRWTHVDPSALMNGVAFGTIKNARVIRGSFQNEPIVKMYIEFGGGNKDDGRDSSRECPLIKPLSQEERVFYIVRKGYELRVVDHKLSTGK